MIHITHPCVLDMSKAQLLQKLCYPDILIIDRYVQPQSSCEGQSFSDSEMTENAIILHHISSKFSIQILGHHFCIIN